MRKLFCLFGLFAISLSATSASEWLYYKHYPWVYDNVSKDWLYLRGSSDGEVYTYRSSTKEWEVFEAPEPTWEEKYEEWIQNPEPYGGLVLLQQIKEAKDSGATELVLYDNNISDITPLAGVTNLTRLSLGHEHFGGNNFTDLSPLSGLINLTWLALSYNNITDLSTLTGLPNLTGLALNENNISDLNPLAALANLTWLSLYENNISDITPLAGLTNLTQLQLYNNNITDLTPLAGLTNLTELNLRNNNISDLTPLAGLMNLERLWLYYNNISDLTPLAGLMNLTELHLRNNNISDITHLAGLMNLTELHLNDNNISDLTPLAGLTNLERLWLDDNNISDSQNSMLEAALPSTTIYWIKDPEPYGGIYVLQKIKEAKDSGATKLNLDRNKISDISPLAGLTNLTEASSSYITTSAT